MATPASPGSPPTFDIGSFDEDCMNNLPEEIQSQLHRGFNLMSSLLDFNMIKSDDPDNSHNPELKIFSMNSNWGFTGSYAVFLYLIYSQINYSLDLSNISINTVIPKYSILSNTRKNYIFRKPSDIDIHMFLPENYELLFVHVGEIKISKVKDNLIISRESILNAGIQVPEEQYKTRFMIGNETESAFVISDIDNSNNNIDI